MDAMFFCVWSRWPFAVVMDFGRYLHTLSGVRPGQVAKCPFLIALIHVEGTGLKHAVCMNCMSLGIVADALALRCSGLWAGNASLPDLLAFKSMTHRLLLRQWSCKIVWASLIIWTSLVVKIAWQP